MPSSMVLKGIGSSAPAEAVFLGGYNATGKQISNGTPVCWSAIASDGKSAVLATSTTFLNYGLFAGIVTSTVGTADYTGAIQAYGVATARTWSNTTNHIPGCGLILVGGKDYLVYGTEGQVGVNGGAVRLMVTALETNSSGGTASAKVFVKAM